MDQSPSTGCASVSSTERPWVRLLPGVPMPDNDLDGVHVTTITITRYLSSDGRDTVAHRVDGDNGLTMILGMLELTKDTVIRVAMGDDE